MNIRTYAIERGGSGMRDCPVIAGLAAKAGCSAHVLYLIGLGHKTPSLELAFKIADATNGAVRAEDLRPDVDWQRDVSGRVTGYQVQFVAPAAKGRAGKKVGGDASSAHGAPASRKATSLKTPRVKGRQGEVAHG